MIEYVILVALIGVGSIVMVRAVSQNINTRLATIVKGLGGQVEGKREAQRVDESMYRKKDLGNFLSGSLDDEKK